MRPSRSHQQARTYLKTIVRPQVSPRSYGGLSRKRTTRERAIEQPTVRGLPTGQFLTTTLPGLFECFSRFRQYGSHRARHTHHLSRDFHDTLSLLSTIFD
jgi:hypothetical protein